MKTKLYLLLFSSVLLLFGCNEANTESKKNLADEKVEETITDTSKLEWEEVLELAEVDLSDYVEYYPWENIHFTEEQFREYMNDLIEFSVEFDDVLVNFEVLDFDGETIEISATGKSDVTFDSDYHFNQYITFLDKDLRYFYLASDYSNGEIHPRIIFYDNNDEVITDNSDFITNINLNQN